MTTTTDERRLGIVLAVGFPAVQALVATAALSTEVEASWVICSRTVLLVVLVAEVAAVFLLLRTCFGGVRVWTGGTRTGRGSRPAAMVAMVAG